MPTGSLLLRLLSGTRCSGWGTHITQPRMGTQCSEPLLSCHKVLAGRRTGAGSKELSLPSPGGGRWVRLRVQTLGGQSLADTSQEISQRLVIPNSFWEQTEHPPSQGFPVSSMLLGSSRSAWSWPCPQAWDPDLSSSNPHSSLTEHLLHTGPPFRVLETQRHRKPRTCHLVSAPSCQGLPLELGTSRDDPLSLISPAPALLVIYWVTGVSLFLATWQEDKCVPCFKVLGDMGADPVNAGVASCQGTGGTSSLALCPESRSRRPTTWDHCSCLQDGALAHPLQAVQGKPGRVTHCHFGSRQQRSPLAAPLRYLH
ncbi:uncharacterized protein LOC125616315 [Marmota marmota marmota]|uniref:uncharacterized protein LOC125616315 n=1 Tax=Marmota marmota marmota TaxID=9994 RepID=UPI0020930DD2|nr:uncharacterized protein LOC125616315 [Marmota marmota marmota]